MTRTIAIALLSLGLALPAAADVKITQKTASKGMGMSNSGISTVYIKGLKMRTDIQTGDSTMSTIFDLASQKMYSFDSKKREAEVWDMGAFAAQMQENVEVSEMKASLTPNGETREIAGQTTTGYDMLVSMPAAMGGNKDMTMTVTLNGPVWIAKGAPGTEEWMAFYEAAAERGWIFTNPKVAKGNPGQARSMTEMYRQMAATGGMSYATDIEIKISAGEGGGGFGGMMGGLMSKMGGFSTSSEVQAVDTSALADDLFMPPAGYELKQQK